MKQYISQWLLIFGIFCLLLSFLLFLQRIIPKKSRILYTNMYTTAKLLSKLSKPTQIIIKDLHINLPIYSATIHNGQWVTTTEGVSYLTSSPKPSEQGNSILYAHNWQSLFGNLPNAKPGEQVQIIFNDNHIKTFTILYTSVVPADQLSVLAPSRDKRITLYTCTGFLDSKRFVAVAVLNKDTEATQMVKN